MANPFVCPHCDRSLGGEAINHYSRSPLECTPLGELLGEDRKLTGWGQVPQFIRYLRDNMALGREVSGWEIGLAFRTLEVNPRIADIRKLFGKPAIISRWVPKASGGGSYVMYRLNPALAPADPEEGSAL